MVANDARAAAARRTIESAKAMAVSCPVFFLNNFAGVLPPPFLTHALLGSGATCRTNSFESVHCQAQLRLRSGCRQPARMTNPDSRSIVIGQDRRHMQSNPSRVCSDPNDTSTVQSRRKKKTLQNTRNAGNPPLRGC